MTGSNSQPRDNDEDDDDARVSRRPLRRRSSSEADADCSPNLALFRRGSREGRQLRSSLQTVESAGAGSLDIYEDGSDGESRQSGGSSVNRARRRHSLDLGGSSNCQSLVVSFSRLNEHELTHLRKWNRRLHRTEVFDKYYFPAKWEASEMDAIVRFLKLEDPSAKPKGGGVRRGSLRGSGSSKKASSGEIGIRRGRLTGGRREMSGSWQSGDTPATVNCLSSSFRSSFKDSADKLTKLLADAKEQPLDPEKITKRALDFIFFPFVHDPKSVLLKRGSVFLRDTNLCNERELMVFSHGFVVADVGLEEAFSLYLALSDREFLTEKSFLEYLQKRFGEMDGEETGVIEKWELQKLFTDMGIPKAENILEELIQSNYASAPGNDDDSLNINWKALHKSLEEYFIQKNVSLNNVKSLDDSGSERDSNSLRSKLLGAFQKRRASKVECALRFSDVVCVDSLNTCHPRSKDIANSSELSFSVTMKGRESDPLIFVCSKPEHRDGWLDAFRPGLIHALTESTETRELRNRIGWQHLVLRSSLISLVIMNDVEALRCVCQRHEGAIYRRQRSELNLLDEYNGFSPLHYATVLGHTDCMSVLLESGSKVSLEDRNGLSPMYHALRLRNDSCQNVLERFGADRNDDLRKLVKREIREEEMKKLAPQANSRLETHIESNPLDVSSSERSEQVDLLVMKAASHFN